PKEPEAFFCNLLLRTALQPVIYVFAATCWLLGVTRLARWAGVVVLAAARVGVSWGAMRIGLMSLEKIGFAPVAAVNVAMTAFACLAAYGFLRYTRGDGVSA